MSERTVSSKAAWPVFCILIWAIVFAVLVALYIYISNMPDITQMWRESR